MLFRSKEQIYEAVFGFDGIGDNSTISTHIKNIRAKLEHFKISPIQHLQQDPPKQKELLCCTQKENILNMVRGGSLRLLSGKMNFAF